MHLACQWKWWWWYLHSPVHFASPCNGSPFRFWRQLSVPTKKCKFATSIFKMSNVLMLNCCCCFCYILRALCTKSREAWFWPGTISEHDSNPLLDGPWICIFRSIVCVLATRGEPLKITHNPRNFPNCGLSPINLNAVPERMYKLQFLLAAAAAAHEKNCHNYSLQMRGRESVADWVWTACCSAWQLRCIGCTRWWATDLLPLHFYCSLLSSGQNRNETLITLCGRERSL